MIWNKKGRIFCTENHHSWMKTHAQVPTVFQMSEDVWRIFFSSRDDKNRSHASFIDVEAGNPSRILAVAEEPVLELGRIGTFDDCGTMPTWLVRTGDSVYMYYIGWTVRNTIPYHNSIGLAVSVDGGHTFKKYSEGPIFSPTVNEPFFSGTSCVLVEDGVWKNWYLSCTHWDEVDGRVEPFYNIKYATSADGIHWDRNAVVAIDYKNADEGGIVRASVLKVNGLYKMWYSYRGKRGYRTNIETSYKIGYAESTDGVTWTRKDDAVTLSLSPEGWDSIMLAYPHVLRHNQQYYMFYNGNGFGQSGMGYAVASP